MYRRETNKVCKYINFLNSEKEYVKNHIFDSKPCSDGSQKIIIYKTQSKFPCKKRAHSTQHYCYYCSFYPLLFYYCFFYTSHDLTCLLFIFQPLMLPPLTQFLLSSLSTTKRPCDHHCLEAFYTT